MKISTEIASAARLVGTERAIELYARAGFDAFDFSMFDMVRYDKKTLLPLPNDHPLAGHGYLDFAKKLAHLGRELGIRCNQSHAPFHTSVKCVRDSLKRAIEATAVAGGEICVIHPFNRGTPEENAEFYASLLPFAKECGVKIACENMWCWNKEKDEASFAACATPESFLKHLELVCDDDFVACLDIGHAEMKGIGTSAPEMIRALGKKLECLHIHDNDRWHDSHQIPYSMKIDFDAVLYALAEIGYDGYFTLEADAYLSSIGADRVCEGIVELARSARRLADEYERIRTEK